MAKFVSSHCLKYVCFYLNRVYHTLEIEWLWYGPETYVRLTSITNQSRTSSLIFQYMFQKQNRKCFILKIAGFGKGWNSLFRSSSQKHGRHVEELVNVTFLWKPSFGPEYIQGGAQREYRLHHQSLPKPNDYSSFWDILRQHQSHLWKGIKQFLQKIMTPYKKLLNF